MNLVQIRDHKGKRRVGLVAADRIGAGRASYLTPQIDQWRRYDPDRRALMKAALESVRDTPGISAALREVVERSLGEG